MAQVQVVPTTLDTITRPLCPRCGAKTWLIRIELCNEPHHERLTFECPVCEITEVTVAQITPSDGS